MSIVLPYHERLLEQASHLMQRDASRPSQANLRRAVSTAYYAVFHFIAEETGHTFIGGASIKRPLRAAVARGIDHGALRGLCMQISSKSAPGNLSAPLRNCLRSIGPVLPWIASQIVVLQDLRHRADYDRLVGISKLEAQRAVKSARETIRAWSSIEGTLEAEAFLLGALTWRNLSGR